MPLDFFHGYSVAGTKGGLRRVRPVDVANGSCHRLDPCTQSPQQRKSEAPGGRNPRTRARPMLSQEVLKFRQAICARRWRRIDEVYAFPESEPSSIDLFTGPFLRTFIHRSCFLISDRSISARESPIGRDRLSFASAAVNQLLGTHLSLCVPTRSTVAWGARRCSAANQSSNLSVRA